MDATPEDAARTPDVIGRFFEADARRDTDAVIALFSDDAVVGDEGGEWHTKAGIREWRLGPVSRYEYATTIERIDRIADDHYRASGSISGNFPGGTANLNWDFSLLVGGLIGRLEIAP